MIQEQIHLIDCYQCRALWSIYKSGYTLKQKKSCFIKSYAVIVFIKVTLLVVDRYSFILNYILMDQIKNRGCLRFNQCRYECFVKLDCWINLYNEPIRSIIDLFVYKMIDYTYQSI